MINNKIHLSGIWKWLLCGKSQQIILFHCLLAALVILISKWFYAFWIGILVFSYFNNKFKVQFFLTPFILANILSAEVFSRALKLNPIIPYEFGKYFLFVLFIYLITRTNIKGSLARYGLLILFLLLPSLFISLLSESDAILKELIFNGFGIVNLALGIIFFSQYKISLHNFKTLLRLIIISTLPFVIWSSFKTPDLSSIDFSLTSSASGIGGFSSNQISTLFGFVFSVCVFQIINKYYFFKNSLLSLSLAMLFLFKALISFSRGGVIVAFVALFLVFFVSRKKIKKSYFKNFLLLIPLLFILFYFTNKLTDNSLLLRFQGETNSTLSGRSEKSLNSISTGRFDIMINDLNIWNDNLFFGTGIGQSPKLRVNYGEEFIISHLEFSRLLAENGIFGLFIIITLIIIIIRIINFRKNILNKSFAVFCFTISILTSFHASMRTSITPILFSFALMQIINERINTKIQKGYDNE